MSLPPKNAIYVLKIKNLCYYREASKIGDQPPELPSMDRRRTIGFRYLLTEQIGEGAVAVVWKAFDIVDDRSVAIKLLKDVVDPDDAARLQMEVAIVSRLRHPNIIRFLDQGVTERGRRYVVMELLEGESLRDRLLRSGPLGVQEGLTIVLQILDALETAHRNKIVHRDIKPENIYLVSRQDGSLGVKLLDFGMAKVLGSSSSLTWSGVLFGTPHYMAPERIQGDDSRSPADIYATAVMTYEILCGHRPFEGRCPEDVMKAHILDEPPQPCQAVPEALRAPLLAAMDKKPHNRPSASFLLEVVRRILEDMQPQSIHGNVPASSISHPLSGSPLLASAPDNSTDHAADPWDHDAQSSPGIDDPDDELEGLDELDELQDLDELETMETTESPAPGPTSDLDIEQDI